MRILYLHQYFCPPGGSGNNRSYDLARIWTEAGHQVSFITSAAYFPEAQRRRIPEGEVRKIKEGPVDLWVLGVDYAHTMPFRRRIRAFLQFYNKALKLARRLEPPDLIYASSTPLTVGELGRKLARKWNKPYVFETVDVWPDVPIGMGIIKNSILKNWLIQRTRKIYRESRAIVTLSEGMRDQVLQNEVEPEKVYLIHNGTDVQAFPYQERQSGSVTEVMYTGTVGMANGIDQLVRVAALLEIWGRSDIRITIVGKGNRYKEVRELARELNPQNLRFQDPVPKEAVPDLLGQAAIGVVCFAPFAVLEANSANKFYDYLSTGLPVVINYQGWQAAYLRQHACGLSSPQGDLEAFASNIVDLADRPELRKEMGLRGRKLVEARFDRNQLAMKLLSLFEAVLEKEELTSL